MNRIPATSLYFPLVFHESTSYAQFNLQSVGRYLGGYFLSVSISNNHEYLSIYTVSLACMQLLGDVFRHGDASAATTATWSARDAAAARHAATAATPDQHHAATPSPGATTPLHRLCAECIQAAVYRCCNTPCRRLCPHHSRSSRPPHTTVSRSRHNHLHRCVQSPVNRVACNNR